MVTQSYTFSYIPNYLEGEIISNPLCELPTYRQLPIMFNWLSVQLEQVQRFNELKFDLYDFGSSYSFYTASNTYIIGDRINGGLKYNNVIFECITSSTTGTFSVNNWLQILPSFIGYQERSAMFDSRIVFEWYLNRYFYTTFRQPNFADTVKSDIFISDNSPSLLTFFIGLNDNDSSYIGINGDTIGGVGTNPVWLGPSMSLYGDIGEAFIINISGTAYSGFPGYSASNPTGSADAIVRKTADWLNYSGMPYTIHLY